MNKYLISILFLFVYISSNTQDIRYFDGIKDEFDEEIKEEINKAESNINEAEILDQDAETYFQAGDMSKALNIYKKTSEIYKSNYRTVFLLFERKLNEKLPEVSEEKAQYLIKLIDEADNFYRISIARRHLAEKERDNLLMAEFYKSAHSKEKEAVQKLLHAYAVLTDEIIEDMTVEKIDYSMDAVFDNSITEDFESRSFTVYDPSVKQNLTYYKAVDYDNTEEISDNKTIKKTNTKNNRKNTNSNSNGTYYRVKRIENGKVVYSYLHKNNNNKNNQSISDTTKGRSDFRIQIGTSILPAFPDQLNRLNKTEMEVNIYKSKLYYKYTVGRFKTFKEAKNYKHAYGLKNTYIVEYRNGKEFRLYLKDYQ